MPTFWFVIDGVNKGLPVLSKDFPNADAADVEARRLLARNGKDVYYNEIDVTESWFVVPYSTTDDAAL